MTSQDIASALNATAEGRALLFAWSYLAGQPLKPEQNRSRSREVQQVATAGIVQIFKQIGKADSEAWAANLVASADRGGNGLGIKEIAEEMFSQGFPPPEPLAAYWDAERREGGPARAADRPGPKRDDRRFRNNAIVRAVAWIAQTQGLKPTRGSAAKYKEGAAESACSIVAKALALNRAALAEESVNDIWKEHLSRRRG